MNKLTCALMATLLATPVFAEQSMTGTVEDFYMTFYDEVPETKRVCKTVQVPVYETRKKATNGADVLGGMIIGGILGKALTGKDNGAAAGAVIGGVAGAERNKTERVITGYRDEQQCTTEQTYRQVERKEYEYSILTFTLDGVNYELFFNK